jgi:uncharacterized membrane protein
MKGLFNFLKASIVGGLLVILPVALVVFLLEEAYDAVVAIVEPLTATLPVDELGGIGMATVVSISIIVALCFVTGLAMQTGVGNRIGSWLENAVLGRLPGYRMMKTLSRQIAGAAGEGDTFFSPAILSLPQDSRQLVYLIEDHGNGFSTIMIPSAPAATSGPVQYVKTDRLQKLQVPLGKVMQSLQECGLGSGPLFINSPSPLPGKDTTA